MVLIETERLVLREISLADAPFVLKLTNEPSWLENIGDKNVHSIVDAEKYVQDVLIKSYQDHGFGLYLVELKIKGSKIGICGLVKRDELDNPDIGFAFLPEYWGMGLASEAGKATLEYARTVLDISHVVGITSLDNSASMRVLEKIGLKFEELIELSGYDSQSRLFVPG